MPGGIIDKDMPLPVSAVAIVCPVVGPTRSGMRIDMADGPQGPCVQEMRNGSVMAPTTTTNSRPRLKERYVTTVRAELCEKLGLGNVMEAPTLEKIVINMGVGRATQQSSLIEGAVRDLEIISGQKPVVTRARKSATASSREGRGHRRQGHHARGPGVGVPRSPHLLGHPPDPGLPGPAADIVRRARQLHLRRKRTVDFP